MWLIVLAGNDVRVALSIAEPQFEALIAKKKKQPSH